MKIKHIFLSLAAVLISMSSCSDVLDVAPDGNLTLEEVFSDPDKVGAFLNSCYNAIPRKGFEYFFFDNLPIACSDDSWTSEDGAGQMVQAMYDGRASASSHPIRDMHDGHATMMNVYWSRYWTQIRLCTQFIEKIDKAAVRDEADRARWKAEAHVLRAYFYSELIKWFGKLPIERDSYSYDQDFSTLKKESVYELAKFIGEDCDAGINTPELPWRISVESDAMRMTKAVAHTIKGKMMLYAASPLHNEEQDHWEEAYLINKKAVEELKANGYELFKTCTAPQTFGTYKGAAYHQMACTSMQYSSAPADKETILQHKHGGIFVWHVAYIGCDEPAAFKPGACPSQELVDAYETIDGEPVLNLAKPYLDEKHLQPNYNKANRMYDPNNPHANRDPRFEATVLKNGDTVIWNNGDVIRLQIYEGGRHALRSEPDQRSYSRTGYMHRKHVTPGASNTRQINNSNWKLFRFAEVLLNYAEAAAEAGHLGDAKFALDEVRSRVGMPPIPAGLSKEDMILRVRNERRVEFAFEELRYFDVRRWQKPDGDLSATDKWITGMKIKKNGDGSFSYERMNIRPTLRFGYENKDLLMPLPLAEASRLETTTGAKWQNRGW